MAKARPVPPLDSIEEELGFKVSELGRLSDDDHTKWLFSDFRIVPRSPDELMLREREEYYKYGDGYPDVNTFPDHELLVPGRVKVVLSTFQTPYGPKLMPVLVYQDQPK